MASKKRIANDLPAQKWYRVLSPEFKALYIHLICIANVAGVFELDIDSFRFHVKCKDLCADDVFTRFGNRVQRIEGHPDKGIIVGYIDFQHTFPKASEQWKWVVKELAKVGLDYDRVKAMCQKEGEQLLLQIQEPQKPVALEEKPSRKIIPPTLEWVKDYCSTRNNSVDAEAFWNFYESKGWKVGGQKMNDWQAAVRTWERNGERAKPPLAQNKTKLVQSPIRKVF